MNSLILYVDRIGVGSSLRMDGILFSEVSLVRVMVDGQALHEIGEFKDSLVCFDELMLSAKGSGRYLIFTCACGVAEDGGWEGVEVRHSDSSVTWDLELAAERLHFEFERADYLSQLSAVSEAVGAAGLPLAPRAVVFPGGFRRALNAFREVE